MYFIGRVTLFFTNNVVSPWNFNTIFLHPELFFSSKTMFINGSAKEFAPVNNAIPSYDIAFEHTRFFLNPKLHELYFTSIFDLQPTRVSYRLYTDSIIDAAHVGIYFYNHSLFCNRNFVQTLFIENFMKKESHIEYQNQEIVDLGWHIQSQQNISHSNVIATETEQPILCRWSCRVKKCFILP